MGAASIAPTVDPCYRVAAARRKRLYSCAMSARSSAALFVTVALGVGACGSEDSGDAPATGGTSSTGGASNTGGMAGSTATGGGAGVGSGGTSGSPGGGGTGGGLTSDDCIKDVTAKPDHVFDCSGLKWNVSVPPACAAGGCGLIMDVHGFSMSGKMEDNNTKLAALGAKNGFIVVSPNADPAPPLSGWVAAEDDPKVFDFMQRTIKVFQVDKKRVHFTGFSQGGDMTWRFICDHSDVIASAAPAGFGHSAQENCYSKGKAPARPMPMLYMHGTKDALVNFSTAAAARDSVIKVLGLTDKSSVSGDSMHTWDRHTNAKGDVFEMLQHEYSGATLLGGHCYPGSTDPGGEPGQVFSFKCDQTAAFNWGEAVMTFFLAHPLP